MATNKREATKTMSSSSLSSAPPRPRLATNKSSRFWHAGMTRTVLLRTILIASLLMAVVLCATLSYFVLHNTEQEVGRQTYESVACSALTHARSITKRKLQGGELMATLMGQVLPDASDWPLITMKGYMPIAQKVAQLSSSNTQSLMVILENPTREEQAKFEAHIQDHYRLEGRPEDAGMSGFGFGIWKPDPAEEAKTQYEDGRLHDISVDQAWGGRHNIHVPLTFHNQANASSLMYNMYSEGDRGMHFDSLCACVEKHHAAALLNTTNDGASGGTSSSPPNCPVVTDMLELKLRPGPAALLFQPIFPANAPTKLVGLATTAIHWEEVLDSVVPDYISGLTCVISTNTTAYTYEIRGGKPQLIGEGDWHDVRYSRQGKSVILNDFATGSQTNALYTLTVYPTDTMLATFSTNSPMAVALGFFAVIAFCTFIFFMYDFFMRHEANQRKAIFEMKRRFVRFISHEIRTPLNTVCMGLELLESELQDAHDNADRQDHNDEPQRRACCNHLDRAATRQNLDFWHQVTADVRENAQVAVSILNDLLNYDKLEMGTLKLETNTVCIWQLLERTIHQFRIQAVNRKIDFQLDVVKPPASAAASEDYDPELGGSQDETTMNVIGDGIRLGQVLRNVISNALKFTPAEGSIHVKAEYVPQGLPHAKPMSGDGSIGNNNHVLPASTSYPRAGAIRIMVKDSGVGLSEEQLQMLFSEGVQFDANRLQHGGGSGLGLNIAKGIVEQHRGTIRAESEGVGKGTVFIIELPLYHLPVQESLLAKGGKGIDDSTSDATPSTSCSSTTASVTMPVKKVLVVEDTQSSRKMLIRLLERVGHVAIPATNGQEAVDAIVKDMQESEIASQNGSHHVPVDTILMDFEMPILKGPDATKQIRELGWTGTILGITGNVLDEDVNFFIRHGADEVLAKPVSLERIKSYWDQAERQESALQRKRKNRESFQNHELPPVDTYNSSAVIPQQQQSPFSPCKDDDEDPVVYC